MGTGEDSDVGQRFCGDELAALLRSAPGWVWEADEAHRLTWISEEFERITGLNRERFIGRSRITLARNAFHPVGDVEAHERLLAAREPFSQFVYDLEGGPPDCRWISVSGFPLFDDHGRFYGYRGVACNVTPMMELLRGAAGAGDGAGLHEHRTGSGGHLARLMAALDVTRDAFCCYDADDRLVLSNQAMLDMYAGLEDVIRPGTSFEALLRAGLERRILSSEGLEPEVWLRRVLDLRSREEAFESVLRFTDGRWVMHREKRTEDGGAIGICTDITGLKRHEGALAAALEKAKLAEAILDELPNPVFAKDQDLRFVLANRAFKRTLGDEATEILGRRAADFTTPELAETFESSERRVLETREDFEVEEDFDQPGIGKYRIVRKCRVETESGTPYVVGALFDISDIRKRENDAEDARRQLAEVLETLPAGVVIYDRDDRYVLANRKMQEALPAMIPAMRPGKSLRDAVELAHDAGYFRQSGDPGLDALYDTDREAWITGYLRSYHVRHRIFERSHANGRWVKAIDTRTEDGTFVGVRVDITELKQREAELQAAREEAVLADRAKSEFLANMSHEIRTPMNGVLGMTELLAKTELTAKQKTFADIILKSGNALLTIINDILDFSKIDAGHIVLEAEPFYLGEAVGDVATLMSSRAKEKDLELIVRVDPGITRAVVGDVGRVRQILTNLVGNAVKFTEKGHVLVNVSGSDTPDGALALQFSVTDTGIGIPKEKLHLIFDKFSQVDASSTRRHEGTGLGLAITSRLVDLMGGEIGVESVEGRGSTFWFTLILPKAAGATPQPLAPREVSNARVLVVDDNSVNRMILREQMEHWGFDACVARDAGEGLDVLRAAAKLGLRVDCAVVDYQMPGMNGLEMVEAMRADRAIADVPVVLLTSVDQSLSGFGARELSIASHLIKPARSSALLEAMVAAMQPTQAAAPVGEAGMAWEPVPEGATRSAEADDAALQGDGEISSDIDVLVAEDNEVNQLVFRQILSEAGLRFDIVESGKHALEAHRRRKPRLILMDVSMPGMSGLEATREIRHREREMRTRVPIIGVTAHALKGDRELCLEAGMDDYLSKPISPRALLEKINSWVSFVHSKSIIK
ncbi:response regulator [Nitratireductor rhodophyticola]|uniref:response regulator n=1 Tax=Nitratireductor rhodophyticola TaxID=2854036 RepID=UPI002AC8B1C7|nr:response regulator [Nitratireductor rhodophyticola]WPZ15690.1 response regulator [Nitratireductor rhodophyticola]